MQLVSKIFNQCSPDDTPTLQTDRETDGQTTYDLNTALCIKSASRGKNTSENIKYKNEKVSKGYNRSTRLRAYLINVINTRSVDVIKKADPTAYDVLYTV